MRILRLDLLAFGLFTNQTLDFSADSPRLHIVHGANEAGKSSALRALRDWLYGIPVQSPDNFSHPYQYLRIGGVLEAADGTRLEFIRRKGRSKTLREPDDTEVFDESRLLGLLGGVDEATFSQRFGIDYQELRRGGEGLVRGGGDLAEILFAAGAGVADLRAIQQRLDDESDALFRPRGSNQRIPQAISELRQAREAIRKAQLPTSKWVEHDKALRQAQERQQEIDDQLAHKRAERSQLDRINRSLPLIGRLRPLRMKKAKLAEAPLLPETFPTDRREAETNLSHAKKDADTAREDIRRLKEELAGIHLPVEVLQHRSAITQLYTDLGSYRKAAKDRPGLVAQRDNAQQRACEILKELGRPLQLAEAESLRLSKAKRQRIQELSGECKALVEKQESSKQAVRKLHADIQHIQEELQQLPGERDVTELERTIRRAQNQGNLDEQHRAAEAELQKLRAQANVELARLPLFDGTLEELEKLPIPSAETIERFENVLTDAERDIRQLEERIDELTTNKRRLQNELDALRLEQDVPTEADLANARRRRDAGWELIKQAWRDTPASDISTSNHLDVAAFINEFALGGDLATAFRASIEAADAVADRLRREADRVALKARLTADLEQTEFKLTEAQKQLQQAWQQRNAVWDEWQAEWASAGVDPLTPREMRSWRNWHQTLAGIAANIRNCRVDLQRLSHQITSLRADLSECLDALDEPPVSDNQPLSAALDHCQQIAGQIRSTNQQRQRLTSDQEKLTRQCVEAKQQADKASKDADDWQTEWAEVVEVLGLDADSRPSEVNAIMDSVDELLGLLKDIGKLEDRISGIDSDAREFEQRVRQLLEQVAPDLLDTLDKSVETAVADLVDRLHRAERNQTRVDGLQNQLEKEEAKLRSAESTIKQCEATLGKLCRQAACRSPDELAQAEERSRTRRETESELNRLEQQLQELAAGTTLDEWIATAEQFDSDQVQADLKSLDDEIPGLEDQRKEVAETIGQHRNELSHMDGSGRAAEVQVQAEHLLATIRSDAEQFIRLRLASAVLSRAMERFREASQTPVLSQAGELFSELTLGSFAGLRADYDDKEGAVLVGVRPGGQTVRVEGLSDGTCDQLYLALRLALLESSLEGREPLPFIVDDVLIMFDDDRAAAALKALARLSETTQVIFFTHHRHIVEIAENTPGISFCTHRFTAPAVSAPSSEHRE